MQEALQGNNAPLLPKNPHIEAAAALFRELGIDEGPLRSLVKHRPKASPVESMGNTVAAESPSYIASFDDVVKELESINRRFPSATRPEATPYSPHDYQARRNIEGLYLPDTRSSRSMTAIGVAAHANIEKTWIAEKVLPNPIGRPPQVVPTFGSILRDLRAHRRTASEACDTSRMRLLTAAICAVGSTWAFEAAKPEEHLDDGLN